MKNNAINTKNKVLAIGITFFAIIVLVGITYTFFSAAISNANNEKINTQTATMRLVFSDNDNGVSGTLNLGQSIIKKFAIENIGTVDAYAKINWYNLMNTYSPYSLSYTLESSTSENGTYTKIYEKPVPDSFDYDEQDFVLKTTTLKDGLLVPANTTIYYKLTIKLNNLDQDQTSDIDAYMYSHFSLEAGEEMPNAADTIKKLAAGANQNSTAEFLGNPGKQYVLSFNGFTGWETSSENCQTSISDFTDNFGTNVTATCQINSDTGNYEIYATGDSRNSNNYFSSEDKCEEYISTQGFNNTTCIKENVTSTCNTLAYDGTSDNNLRYVGDNPCNHVIFNNSPGQIIGVMNNVDDGTGVTETRVKIAFFADDKIKVWSTAGNNYLNSNLFNYSGHGNSLEENIYIFKPAKRYLRGYSSNATSLTASSLYDLEKTTGSVYTGNPTDWTGFFSPINASDYVQSVGGSNRTSCLSKTVISNGSTPSQFINDCGGDLWLGGNHWTITAVSDNNTQVFFTNYNYGLVPINSAGTGTNRFFNPTAYLNTFTEFSGGNGTENDPYVLTDGIDNNN